MKGRVALPASKSISNRLLLLQAVSRGMVKAAGLSDSEDTRAMLRALETVDGISDIGHAGTAMRFLTAYFAVTPGEHLLTGSERMQNRPIGKLVDALQSLGADIRYTGKQGFPPLLIQGKELKGGRVSIDGSTSSQYISALLMIGPLLPQGLHLTLSGKVISASYIRLTLGLMERAGITHEWSGNTIHIPHQKFVSASLNAEPDWSAASYWYSVAALSDVAEIMVEGLNEKSLQGDAAIEKMFARLGVRTSFTSEGALLQRIPVEAIQFCQDFLETPDMVQTLAVTCVQLGLPFFMTGTQSLRIKETDRITALQKELAKFGARIEYSADGTLAWNGKFRADRTESPLILTYQDHRMAMSFAPAVMKCGQIRIDDPGVVAKSYPGFWDELKKLGIVME
ncbi:MAG: 3-phosphoshikimate 1-carboxyvinyltransferase [Bacteroidales bacterium]